MSAIGLKSYKVNVSGLFGRGMMVEVLNVQGTIACNREVLKISVYTPASCSAQTFRTLGDIKSSVCLSASEPCGPERV